MITTMLAMVGIAWQAPQSTDTAVYNNFVLNLAFTYPKSWTVSTKKEITKMSIPVGDGSSKATLEIYDAIFGAEPEAWQKVQLDINKQLGREVSRQWQEEVYGVPMLFTKVHFFDRGVDSTALTGLLYNRAYKKLLIRLVATTGTYDSAEFGLRTVLQSLRTIDGSVPKPETPNRPVLPEETKPAVSPSVVKVTYLQPHSGKDKLTKGPQIEKATSGGRAVEFRYEKEWTLTKTAGGYELKHPALRAPLTLTLNSVLDSDPPITALLKSGAQSLALFDSVTLRQEMPTASNKAGNSVTVVWRDGTVKGGPYATCEAVGANGDYYWLLSYRNANTTPAERKVISNLLQTLSIDLAAAPQ